MTIDPLRVPATSDTPLVRTYFGDAAAWQALSAIIETPNADGFRAYVTMVDDPRFADVAPERIVEISDTATGHALLILADAVAMSDPAGPLLCIETCTGRRLRVVANALWSIENNLSLANMDFEEFVAAADASGIFHGFG